MITKYNIDITLGAYSRSAFYDSVYRKHATQSPCSATKGNFTISMMYIREKYLK